MVWGTILLKRCQILGRAKHIPAFLISSDSYAPACVGLDWLKYCFVLQIDFLRESELMFTRREHFHKFLVSRAIRSEAIFVIQQILYF